MKTIVYLPTAKLDLSKQKFSIQENNAKVSDSQFTKIIFPSPEEGVAPASYTYCFKFSIDSSFRISTPLYV